MVQTTYGLVGAVDRECVVSTSLKNSSNVIDDSPLIKELLDSIPSVCMILDESQKIVFANRALYRFLGISPSKTVNGLSVGEALRCAGSRDSKKSMQQSRHCELCEITRALDTCATGHRAMQESAIVIEDGSQYDMRIGGTPFRHLDRQYILLTLSDISHEKRRQALERIFFNDVLDTASSVQGFGQLMRDICTDENEDMAAIITDMSTELVENIQAQKVIASAEKGDLLINMSTVNSMAVLKEIVALYRNHEVALDRNIKIDPESVSVEFDSDPKLVRHVLGNMILNALEATMSGQTVTVGCRAAGDDKVEFTVHNTEGMPTEVQLRVFQRTFSTKGAGRGLGAYSMKMLTERYLQGLLSFTSSEESGTTFSATYPRKMLPAWIVAK